VPLTLIRSACGKYFFEAGPIAAFGAGLDVVIVFEAVSKW
jgi:hypothetical protein